MPYTLASIPVQNGKSALPHDPRHAKTEMAPMWSRLFSSFVLRLMALGKKGCIDVTDAQLSVSLIIPKTGGDRLLR